METGNIVEYIDRQKFICGVVIQLKSNRLRILTEANREVNLSLNRISHKTETSLDLSMSRDKLVESLKKIAAVRIGLIKHINIKEIWKVLNTEQEWISLETMTALCFPDHPCSDHEAAVARAFFENRIYFKFNNDRFHPYTEEQVEQFKHRAAETERKNRRVEKYGTWLKNAFHEHNRPLPDAPAGEIAEFTEILKSFYLFEKESKYFDLGRELLTKAGIGSPGELFNILVKLGVFDENENTDLHKYNIPISFSRETLNSASFQKILTVNDHMENGRKDLTSLSAMTIDGQATLDFDDALSIEDKGDHYLLGIHIIDVAHYIKKRDRIDAEAISRGSSIYTPDLKIPMLPPDLAENSCSLKTGAFRPAISVMVKLTPTAEILDHDIFPSIISVEKRLTYYDVNQMSDKNREIIILREIAEQFRKRRFAQGAVQITLPDININLGENTEIVIHRINRESPGRMLVAELMIMANWLMARLLADNNVPAIFRSQSGPKERLYRENEGTLFQNYMQRKTLSRFVLGNTPGRHSGLGLDAYVTGTSPIRKYFDLISQRQIRSIHGKEKPYTPQEIDRIIDELEQPMAHVSKIQHMRNRYWILKYLEKNIGKHEEAMVLYKRRNSYQILLTSYMIEYSLPISGGMVLRPESLIRVKIQHASARNDSLAVFLD